MHKLKASLLLTVLCVPALAPAQKFIPKSIQFKGAPDYTDKELMAAADLKTGEVLTSAEMNQHSQKLMDSGLFSGLTFKFDGQDLIFQLTPAAQLYSIRLENLPFSAGPELEAKLRERFPLYHGKVPNEGGLLNDVQGALQEMLKTQGIEAVLMSAPYSDPIQHKITAISFSISSPSMVLGHIATAVPLEPLAQNLLAQMEGKAYDHDQSAVALQNGVESIYREKGYLDAVAQASQQSALSITPETVRVPFSLSIKPGPLYHVMSIQIAPGLLVTQADFDKQSQVHAGDVADGSRVAANWRYIERQYHNRGYMKARINAVPTRDAAQGTVQYAVSVEPGPVFTMGTFTVQNVSDDLRAMIVKAWKIQAGEAFNEGAILGMFATTGVNPQLERIGAVVKIKYDLKLNETNKTVDVVLRLERKS